MDTKLIAIRIKNARINAGFTQKEVADRLGMTYQAISNYERGKNRIEVSILSKLCELYGVTVPEILHEDTKSEVANVEKLGEFNPTHKIPILGRISAGLPLYAEENIEGYTYTELNSGAEYFALRVKGDSMTAARIFEGDIIIVRRQDIVENGSIAVVLVDDHDATVKIFSRHDNLVTLMPQSHNPVHQPQIYDLRETKIDVLGLVVKCEFSLI